MTKTPIIKELKSDAYSVGARIGEPFREYTEDGGDYTDYIVLQIISVEGRRGDVYVTALVILEHF